MSKDGTINNTAVVKAEVNKSFSTVIDVSTTVAPHSLLTIGIVTAYFGIHVSYHQEQIMLWNIIVIAHTSHLCPHLLPHM